MAHSPSADPSGTGHTAIVVIVANDMWRKKWSQTSLLLHFFNFLQMIRLLATRGHYSIDIVIGTSTLRKILMDFFAQDISVLIFLLWIVRRSFVCIFFFTRPQDGSSQFTCHLRRPAWVESFRKSGALASSSITSNAKPKNARRTCFFRPIRGL